MSTFGSGEAGVAILVACGLLVPIFGWWPLGIACIVVVGWGVILSGANSKFYPDGTRRPQQRSRQHGRKRRGPGGEARH
jgi:hypothetical protein